MNLLGPLPYIANSNLELLWASAYSITDRTFPLSFRVRVYSQLEGPRCWNLRGPFTFGFKVADANPVGILTGRVSKLETKSGTGTGSGRDLCFPLDVNSQLTPERYSCAAF